MVIECPWYPLSALSQSMCTKNNNNQLIFLLQFGVLDFFILFLLCEHNKNDGGVLKFLTTKLLEASKLRGLGSDWITIRSPTSWPTNRFGEKTLSWSQILFALFLAKLSMAVYFAEEVEESMLEVGVGVRGNRWLDQSAAVYCFCWGMFAERWDTDSSSSSSIRTRCLLRSSSSGSSQKRNLRDLLQPKWNHMLRAAFKPYQEKCTFDFLEAFLFLECGKSHEFWLFDFCVLFFVFCLGKPLLCCNRDCVWFASAFIFL